PPSSLLAGIDADHDVSVVREAVGRNLEIDWRRDARKDAPGEIELRAVAGTEESARPVRRQHAVRACARREAILREAAEVRADAEQHEVLGLDGARGVLGVVGLFRIIRARIAQAGVVIAEALDHIGRATHDEYRLAAPLDLQHAARLELADVDLDRSALGLQDERNGTAAKATPTAPVSVVAAVRSCRRPLSIASVIARFSFVDGIDALYTAVHVRPEADAAMSGMSGWLRWISPWIALGLAAALAFVLLRPAPEAVATAPAPPLPVPGPAPEPSDAPAHATEFVSYADAVDATAPAVVNIYTERRVVVPDVSGLPPQFAQLFGDVWPDYRERVERSLGSGIIWDVQGHVVTNYHVIAQATQIKVQLKNGKSGTATLVGADPDTDLAVLKISLGTLPIMPLGRSDKLRVGEPVLAIGNPIGLGQTVTQGIVSATGRGKLGVTTFENFIQTDAAINLGNSGGALVDGNGKLVGLNSAIAGRQAGIEGIGFAIPVDLVRG